MFQIITKDGGRLAVGSIVSLKVWDQDKYVSVNSSKTGITLVNDVYAFKQNYLFRVYGKRRTAVNSIFSSIISLFKTDYIGSSDFIGLEPITVPETFLLGDGSFGLKENLWIINVKQSRNPAMIPNQSFVYFTKYNTDKYLYGNWISGDLKVQDTRILPNGEEVYIAFDGTYTKMVTQSGVAKYYTGGLELFNPDNWGTYQDAGNNYKYRDGASDQVLAADVGQNKISIVSDFPDNFSVEDNDPFMIVTLAELYAQGKVQELTDGVHREFLTKVIRPLPPNDKYLSLGDCMFTFVFGDAASAQANYLATMRNMFTVFVKKDSGDASRPYAKYIRDSYNKDVPSSDQRGLGKLTTNCGSMFRDKNGGDGALVYTPEFGIQEGEYVQVGSFVQVYGGAGGAGSYPNIVGLRSDLCQRVTNELNPTLDTLLRKDKSLKNITVSEGGRKLAYSNGAPGGCDFEVYSTTLIYDRTGLDSDLSGNVETVVPPGYKTYLSTFAGVVRTTGGNLTDMFNRGFYEWAPLYILFPFKREALCCRDQSLGPGECGIGAQELKSTNQVCVDKVGKKLCVASRPNDFVSKFCQKNMCKTSLTSNNKMDCDKEYGVFCNQTDSEGKYYNYLEYPDLCACFMGTAFQTALKDQIWNRLTTKNEFDQQTVNKNNIKIKRALNLDVTDPAHKWENCLVNSLCREGAQVPRSLSEFRGGNSVVSGSKGLAPTCLATELCIQDIKVNNSGQINTLNVNQTATCKTTLQRQCIEQSLNQNGQIIGNAKYSKCNIKPTPTATDKRNGYVRFQKTLIEDLTGECAEPGTNFDCLVIQEAPILDECNGAKRKTVFQVINGDAFPPDIIEAIKSLPIYKSFLKSNPVPSYDYFNKQMIIYTDCADCQIGVIPLKDRNCVLKGNQWKGFSQKQVIKPPSNYGKCNTFDSTPFESECLQDKDCKVNYVKSSKSCQNGAMKHEYTIVENSSADGKTCEQVILKDLLDKKLDTAQPQNFLRVNMSSDLTKATADFSCQNCYADYVVKDKTCKKDPNDGSMYFTKVGKMILKEFGGGQCPDYLQEIVGKEIKVNCSIDQDCMIDDYPITDVCDPLTGLRTLEFGITRPSMGNGSKCLEVATSRLSSLYDPIINLSENGEVIKLETSCDKALDCKIDAVPFFDECDSVKGIRQQSYKIISEEENNGLSCQTVANARFKNSEMVSVKGRVVDVYSQCAVVNTKKDSMRFFMIFGLIAIVILLIVIFRKK